MNDNIPFGGNVSNGFLPPPSTPVTEEETVSSISNAGGGTKGDSSMEHVFTNSLSADLLLAHATDPDLTERSSSELSDHVIVQVTAANHNVGQQLEEVPARLGHDPRSINQAPAGTSEFNHQLAESLYNATLPQSRPVGGALDWDGPYPVGTRVKTTLNVDVPAVPPEDILNNIATLGAEGSARHFINVVNTASQRATTDAAQDNNPDLFNNRGVVRWTINAPPLLAHAGSILSLVEQGAIANNNATTMLNVVSHASILMAHTTRQTLGRLLPSVTVLSSAPSLGRANAAVEGDKGAVEDTIAAVADDHEYSAVDEIDRLATLVQNLNHANQAHAAAGHANQAVLIDANRQLLSAIGQAVYSVRAVENL